MARVAKIPDGTLHSLDDIKYVSPNLAMAAILEGVTGRVNVILESKIQQINLLYRAKVAKRTGDLSRSGQITVQVEKVKKGQQRLVAKLTVGGDRAVGEWNGEPFPYGVLHEHGAKGAKRSRFPAAKDLQEIVKSISTEVPD